MRFRYARPESAKAFPLPSNDRVGLDVQQGITPARPEAAERNPKQPIQARQSWALTFSLEGLELHSQSDILEGNGLVTAQDQSNESNERQQQGWHLCMLLHTSVYQQTE
jgi:hypothetical protein